jgi:hypothetical protein
MIDRIAYALLYYTGIPFERVMAFGLATFSTFYIAYVVVVGVA